MNRRGFLSAAIGAAAGSVLAPVRSLAQEADLFEGTGADIKAGYAELPTRPARGLP